jgi:hypothetical protein
MATARLSIAIATAGIGRAAAAFTALTEASARLARTVETFGRDLEAANEHVRAAALKNRRQRRALARSLRNQPPRHIQNSPKGADDAR